MSSLRGPGFVSVETVAQGRHYRLCDGAAQARVAAGDGPSPAAGRCQRIAKVTVMLAPMSRLPGTISVAGAAASTAIAIFSRP